MVYNSKCREFSFYYLKVFRYTETEKKLDKAETQRGIN
jgi:hypothetical protein